MTRFASRMTHFASRMTRFASRMSPLIAWKTRFSNILRSIFPNIPNK
jgi:hypothetical protein